MIRVVIRGVKSLLMMTLLGFVTLLTILVIPSLVAFPLVLSLVGVIPYWLSIVLVVFLLSIALGLSEEDVL